jgi:FtsH-binding integral membrane protein
LVVVAAACMTAFIVIGLTAYAYYTKTDFTPLGGSMTVVLFSLMAFGFMCIFFGPTMHLIYCLIGVVVFGIYLVMDTQMIVGGKAERRYQINHDDYIIGALTLYLDIIQIFLFILQLFDRK